MVWLAQNFDSSSCLRLFLRIFKRSSRYENLHDLSVGNLGQSPRNGNWLRLNQTIHVTWLKSPSGA